MSKESRANRSTRAERTDRKYAVKTNKTVVWYDDQVQLVARIKDETNWLRTLAKKDDKQEALRKQSEHLAILVDELSRIIK